MDLGTLVGLILAFGGIFVGYLMEGGRITALFEPSAAIIVFGGSAGATIISFSLKHSLGIINVLRQAFIPKHTDREAMLQQIVDLARQARRSGILTLEAEAKKLDNVFLREAIQLVVDGTTPELVREILEIEVYEMRRRHKAGADFFTTWGGYAPTLGVLGTVMGLVHMLESLDEPGAMGPAIATAFIATFYGVGFANIFLLPIAAKLHGQSEAEVASYEMAIEGVLSLQAGDNPRVVAMRMRSFLAPDAKRKLDEER